MAEKDVIELLVEGGKAGPDASSAPKISAYKLNIGEVFKKINEKTADYKGMQVPVKIIIDKDAKSFEIKIGTPPVSSLIKKELGIEKAKTSAAEKAEQEARVVVGEGEAPVEEETKEEKKAEVEEKEEEEEVERPEDEEEKEGEKEKPEVEATEEEEVIGNLTMKQVVKIARMKRDDLLSKDLKSAAKQVVGTAVSMMGIHVEGKKPKDVIKDIDEGKYDHLLKED